MGLNWSLCDIYGRAVADCADVLEGSKVTVPVGGIRTAELILPFGPDAAEAVPLMHSVKCWLDGELIFAGDILDPDFDVIPGRRVTIPAIDPGGSVLMRAYVNNRLDTNFGTLTGVFLAETEDYSETIARLMEHARPTVNEGLLGVRGAGLVRGNLATSVTRLLPPPQTGAEVWASMQAITAFDDGPDIELRPVDRTDGILCEVDTHYPMQGIDRSTEVVYEASTGLNNCSAFKWQPAGSAVINRYTVQGNSTEGQPPLRYQANQAESQLVHRIRQGYEGRQGDDFNALRRWARAACAVAAFPPDNFEVTGGQDDGSGFRRDPITGEMSRVEGTYGRGPRIGPDPGGKHDAWIGDILGVVAYDRPTVELETSGRLVEATFTQMGSGVVVTEAKLNPTLRIASVV